MTQNSNQDDTQPGDGLPEMLHVPSLWVRVATFSLRSFYVFVAGVWMYVAYVVLFPGWPSSIGELIEAAQRKPVTPVPVHAPSLAEQAAARQRELVRAAAEAAAMASEKETQRRRDEHWERRKEIIERFTGVHVSAIDGRRAVLWVTNCRECAHSAASHPVWPKFELYIEPTKEILPTFAYLRALDTDDNFTQFGLCSSNWHNADNTEKAAGPPPCNPVPIDLGVNIDALVQDQPLRFSVKGAGSIQGAIWKRVEDDPVDREGLPQRTGETLFKAVIAQGSVPVGKLVERERVAWQPMAHRATGVQWIKFTRAPSSQVILMLNRAMQDRMELAVEAALMGLARGQTPQTTIDVSFVNSNWLVVQASGGDVGAGKRELFESHSTFSIDSGKQLGFTQAFHYATLKRLDNTIVMNEPGATDQGILSAALKELGPRVGARCMQRWLAAHNCSTMEACTYRWDIPRDMTLYPGGEGVSVQFNHWLVEEVARGQYRELQRGLTGEPWKSCVVDTVVIPWNTAKLALRKEVKLELP